MSSWDFMLPLTLILNMNNSNDILLKGRIALDMLQFSNYVSNLLINLI